MANTYYRGIASVNSEPQRAGVCVSTTFCVCVCEPKSMSKSKSTVLYLLGTPLVAHDAQVKLVFFLRCGILTVVVASHSYIAALSTGRCRSVSLSPLLVLLCRLSSVWCWQAEPLHPLPATVLLPSVGLSNKPEAGRHRIGGEGSLRKGRRGTGRKSSRKIGVDEGRNKDHRCSHHDSGYKRPVRSAAPLPRRHLGGGGRKKTKIY